MKAAIYRRYGPPDVVQITDVPRPDLEIKDVLIKVRATTVTAGDSRLRSAKVPRGFGVSWRSLQACARARRAAAARRRQSGPIGRSTGVVVARE